MFIKNFFILMFFISNFILVGHSLVPHQHKNHLHNKAHNLISEHHPHSTDDHDHDDHDEPSVLSDLLGFVNHSNEYFSNKNETPVFEQRVINDLKFSKFDLFEIRIIGFSLKAKNNPIYNRDSDYPPPPNVYKALRAPPVSFS
jgi:hypothetical protein